MNVRLFFRAVLIAIVYTVALPKVRGDRLDDDREIVQHAAAAVELRPPRGWHVSEISFGREIRLVITPPTLHSKEDRAKSPIKTRDMPNDCMWLTFHARQSASDSKEFAELRRLLVDRLRLATGGDYAAKEEHSLTIGKWPAIRQDFAIQARQAAAVGEHAARRGFHVLAKSPWGILEVHAVSPSVSYEGRSKLFEQTLADMKLQPPSTRKPEVDEALSDASRVMGSWKSFRSRLRLYGNGRIEIELDRPRNALHNGAPGGRRPEVNEMITGRFEARNDLIFVRWDDGSRLNFRWRLRGDRLLLTDHEGQISQLRRILE